MVGIFKKLILRRSHHEPIEYLVESVSFYGEELYVSYGALIPRPETEILVQKALDLIVRKSCTRIAEIGVGSGAISVLLASKNPKLEFHASDISPEALFNAYVNRVRFGAENLTLHRSAYLDFNKALKIPFDLLLANPPYIKEGEILPPTLRFEPQNALFGGKEAMKCYCILFNLALIARFRF